MSLYLEAFQIMWLLRFPEMASLPVTLSEIMANILFPFFTIHWSSGEAIILPQGLPALDLEIIQTLPTS